MSKDPAILFYTSDFISGVSFLTMEQRGQYITLLCEQHQCGHIPKDRMIKVLLSYDNPVMTKFVIDSDGKYYNERMDIEVKKRASYCESRKLASHSRKIYVDHTIDHTIDRMDNGNSNDIINTNIKSKEGMQGEIESKKFIPPTIEQVIEYCNERNNGINPNKWMDFYISKGWMIGKNKMKDWRAAVRTWEKTEIISQPKKTWKKPPDNLYQ